MEISEPVIPKELEGKTQEDRINWYSNKIFGKNAKDLKYLYVTNYIHTQLLQEELTRTGLYQWLNVFKGEIKYPRDVEDYNNYDIVQVNMSGQDSYLVGDIKEAITNDNTKIILNNDYTTEMWGNSFMFPSTLARDIKDADMIFGTEYYQATALSELCNRKCFIIPHPADVKRLKSIPQVKPKDILTTVWRRYDNHYYIPHLVTRNHGLTTQLVGYDDKVDPKTFLATTLYDYVLAGTNYFDFTDQLRESKIIYDPFTYHSYSRTTVDTAALGVPVVGSSRTQSMRVCYPFTSIDPYDVLSARKLIEKLNTDEDFYKLVKDTALQRVELYNHINSKERYLAALYESISEERTHKKKIKKRQLEKTNGDDMNKILSGAVDRKK